MGLLSRLFGGDRIQKNFQDLSYSWSNDSIWGFYIAGKAKKASEMLEEILNITKKVFEITNGFFIPVRIKYSLLTFSHDSSAIGLFDRKNSYGHVNKSIVIDQGISFDMLKEDVENIIIPEGLIRYIGSISLEGRTKFVFKDRELFIGGNIKNYMKPGHDSASDEDTVPDLLWIDIEHTPFKDGRNAEPDEPAYYHIMFQTIAGVYFEDSDIGRKNRNLLRGVLKNMYASFNVVGTSFTSDWFSEKEMEFIAFGNDLKSN